MVSQYPEQWTGWADHARQGGGVFDSPESFVFLLDQCWKHYVTTSDISRYVSLSPPPIIQVIFRTEALQNPAWQHHFAHLRQHFVPALHGISLPVVVQELASSPETEPTQALPELRNFYFRWTHDAAIPLRCFFYVGRQLVGGVDLGRVSWHGDRRRLAIQRSLFGRTKQSDISACFQASPHGSQLPESMQRDLTFLGWNFAFAPQSGEMIVSIETVAALGYLEGGDFLLKEGQHFSVGESVDFYQGLQDGVPTENLRCRLLIVSADIQPTAPELSEVALMTHRSANSAHSPHVEILARVQGMSVQDTTMSMQLEPGGISLTLTKVAHQPEGALFRGMTEKWNPAWEQQDIRCIPHGNNRYGLSFPPHLAETITPRDAVFLRYDGPIAIPKGQLQREWELIFTMQLESAPFDLNDLTLYLRGMDGSILPIPLANMIDNRLIFRYLPRYSSQKVDLEIWRRGELLDLWVESARNHPWEAFSQQIPWLSHHHNRPEQPLQQLRILDLDDNSQLIPAEKKVTLPPHAELVLEGHHLQVIGPLSTKTAEGSTETWDLVLVSFPQPRQIELLHQGGGWMQPVLSSGSTGSSRDIRSLWLSCGHKDSWIDQPRERTPQGGPCLAFGLGFGSQNEMAQIQPSSQGFRVFRHRPNTAVFVNGQLLPVETYGLAEGLLLPPTVPAGWLLVDRGLLRYHLDTVHGMARLSLALIGYFLKRPDVAHPILQILCGDVQTLHPSVPSVHDQVSQLRLTEQGRATVLTLSLPYPPTLQAYPPLQVQERRTEILASPLRYGQPYRRHSLSLSFWQILDPQTHRPSQHPLLPELPLLIHCASMFGRYRYALVRRRDKFGYWYDGSHFIENIAESEPMLAPDYPRTTLDGVNIPPHTLLIGCDGNLADLLLPPVLAGSHRLPFGISLQGRNLAIIPVESPCSLWTWHVARDGSLLAQETSVQTQPLSALLPEQGRILFRCDRFLFEISTHPEELQALPQAEIAFSIRGIFHSARTSLTIGGLPETSDFPLADPIPSHPIAEPLFHIYSPALDLCYRGQGIVGLRQPQLSDTLRYRLEQDILATPLSHQTVPLSLLKPWVAKQNKLSALPQPAFQHERSSLALPDGFLRSSSWLRMGDIDLQYHLRQSPDLYPPPERVPAWLSLRSGSSWSFLFSSSPDGFLAPAADASKFSGTFHTIALGRYDENTDVPEHVEAQAFLSRTTEQGQSGLKINLFGFLPRFAVSVVRENNECFLLVPEPKSGSSYHVVVKDMPITKATRLLLDQPIYLHINHLVVCTLTPQPHGIRFTLLGYLLGHQQDPARAVVLGQSNTVGSIHLHKMPYHGKIALQRAVCPAHFLVPSSAYHVLSRSTRHTKSNEASHKPDESSQPPHTPDSSVVRTFGPVHLTPSLRVGLVDLQHETSHHPIFQRPISSDRLLWFDGHVTDPGTLLPVVPGNYASQYVLNTDSSQASNAGGSSFFFDQTNSSQGSSFFFDPPAFDPAVSSVSTAPVISAKPRQESQTKGQTSPQNPAFTVNEEQEMPLVVLGWFQPGSVPFRSFGIVSSLPGPRSLLRFQQGRLRLEPEIPQEVHPQDHDTAHSPYPLAVWRGHQWYPVQGSYELYEESWIQIGYALFSVSYQPQSHQICLRYRGIWLPAHQDVFIHGSPSSPGMASDTTPTRDIAISENAERIEWFLTGLPPGFYASVVATQRGHRIELKSGLSVHEQADHSFVISAPPQDSFQPTQKDG